jgi:hypothetical protein
LVATPSRIIEVTPDGTFQACRYADIPSLAVDGGRKKLIGRDFMWLRGNIAPGNGALTWLLSTGYYEHNMRIGKAAEDACSAYNETGSNRAPSWLQASLRR